MHVVQILAQEELDVDSLVMDLNEVSTLLHTKINLVCIKMYVGSCRPDRERIVPSKIGHVKFVYSFS